MGTERRFTIQPQIPEPARADAARLFWEAFGGKLDLFLRPEAQAIRFLSRVLDPRHGIAAVSPEGELLGIAGFKTSEGAMIGGTLGDLTQVYGAWGGLWRGLGLWFLERSPAPDALLMDGICVDSRARGLGVGTALLQAVKQRARSLGKASVRLDVIDTNPRARALYERQGFVPTAQTDLGPLRWLFGFQSATTMHFEFERLDINH